MTQATAPLRLEDLEHRITMTVEEVAALLGLGRTAAYEAWGDDYGDEDLVFARVDGSPVHPHSFSQTFERVVARSGLPPIPLHGLRHTHATVGLALGVPAKVISERLGHEDVAFTLKQYAHVLPGMQADAARRIASAVMDDEEDADQEEEPSGSR